MKFSVHVPIGEVGADFQTPVAARRIALTLEEEGFDAVNVTDHPAPDSKWLHANGHDALDPFTALAFLAAPTSRLLVHTNIVVLPYRNPFITAKAAATLQVLSGGRLILGVGIGYQQVEFEALGVEFKKRGALMDEALAVLEQAWSGGPVTMSGRSFVATAVEPRPAPHPRPRVWIGGGSDRAVERAARFGDAWSPFLSAPTNSAVNRAAGIASQDDLAAKIARIALRRAELGRAEPFEVAIDLGGQHHPVEHTVAEAERFADLVGEFGTVGVDWMCIKPHADGLERFLDTLRWYGQEVLPRAR